MEGSQRVRGRPGSEPGGPTTLAFRVGRIPVRLGLGLLLTSLAFGLGARHGILAATGWSAGLLVTLFAHEMSHAVAARAWGVPAGVELALFRGSDTTSTAALPPLRRVLVHVAGPASNLVLAATAFGLASARPSLAGALHPLAWMNVTWGALNLLPILPFDCGKALVALLDALTGGRGERPMRVVSIALAAILGAAAVYVRAPILLLICFLVALQNVRALPHARSRRNVEALMKVHVQAAFDALEAGDAPKGVTHCLTVLAASKSPASRREAVRLLAYAYASTESWAHLMDLLESGGAMALEDDELVKYERAARGLGRAREAARIASLRTFVA